MSSSAEYQQLRDEAARCLGRGLTDAEWEWALPRAKRKLSRIIEQEGDAGGIRLQPWYLAKLIEEAVSQEMLSQYTIMHSMVIEAQRQIAGNPICTVCSGCQEIKKAASLRDDPTTPKLYHRGEEISNEIINVKA